MVFISTAGGKIYAVDRNSGSLKWTYPQGEGVYIGSVSSTPAIDTATGSNAICVGSEDGKLYSLDRTNGSLNWTYNAAVLLIRLLRLMKAVLFILGLRTEIFIQSVKMER